MVYVRKVAKECKACGADRPSTEAPDPCLGRLGEGVQYACCGHGQQPSQCYLKFADGRVVRGEEARQEQIRLGGNPAELVGDKFANGWRKKAE